MAENNQVKPKSWWDLKEKYNEKDYEFKKVIDYFDFYIYLTDFENVYEPSDDSFLLIDAFYAEKNFLQNRNFKNSVEIGCGSGIVSLSFLDIISETKSKEYPNHFLLDINKDCIKLAQRLLINYDYKANFIESNCFKYFENNPDYLESIKFDFIFFNPVIKYEN